MNRPKRRPPGRRTAQLASEPSAARRSAVRRLLGYTAHVRRPLTVGLGLDLLAVTFDLVGPFLIGLVVDRGFGVSADEPLPFSLGLMMGIYLVSILLSSLCHYGGAWQLNRTANGVVAQVQRDLFNHLHRLPVSDYDSLPAGTVVSRVTSDTKAFKSLFQVALTRMLTTLLYMAGILIALAWVDVRMMWIVLAFMPIVTGIVWDYRRRAAGHNGRYRKAYSDLNGQLNETLQGMPVIQAFNREQWAQANFDSVNDRVYRAGVRLSRLYAISAYNLTQTLQYVILAAALIYFASVHLGGAARAAVPVGQLYVFIDYMTKLFDRVSNMMSRIGEMERSFSAADHIFELLDAEPEASDPEASDDPMPEDADIDFESVTFAYQTEPVLRSVSFHVPAGSTAAFVGATGAGKSTILNLVLGFYRPQSGRILFGGRDAQTISMKRRREQMAIVLQEPYLFNGTIGSNITLRDPRITAADAEAALRAVGGDRLLDRLPRGLDTPVMQKRSDFSAGERQLISFARALVRNPRILILDEATAHVDSETEAVIGRGIRRLAEGRTTFIIAHRLSTIRDADQIMVMERGEIAERGSHDDLMARPGRYRELCEMAQLTGAGGDPPAL